jgi:hypothetical protein
MLSPEQINEIHRLHLVEKWPQRRIARHLHIGRHTLAKYLDTPAPPPSRRDRTSQRLQTLGYDGGITILKDYLQAVRKNAVRAGLTCAWSPPGRAFRYRLGPLRRADYNGDAAQALRLLPGGMPQPQDVSGVHAQPELRDLRALSYSCLPDPGRHARELWFDNLATAVAEHDGNLVRFNPRFLAFAREYSFIPRACHVPRPGKKGKSNAPSDMCARTSGRCVPSPIWPT